MQHSDELIPAIENYLVNKATEAEKLMVNEWYHSFTDSDVQVNTDHADYYKLVEARLRMRIENSTGIKLTEAAKQISLWPQLAITAAAIVVIFLSIWLYTADRSALGLRDAKSDHYSANILPGKNTAKLTLPNGKSVTLRDTKIGVVIDATKIVYNDGENLNIELEPTNNKATKGSKKNSMMSVSTPRGGTYQVVLPDGSKVWLNAETTISFSSVFSDRERKILLDGEGYFEVATSYVVLNGQKVKQKFIVETRAQQIEVLGTSFNVDSYTGRIKTTLVEGRVKLKYTGKKEYFMKPNQQAIFKEDEKSVKIAEIDPVYTIAWKNGVFAFDNATIYEVMEAASRWYNVQVEYQENIQNVRFTGTISRFENINKLLEAVELTGSVKFKWQGRRILVMK